MLLRRALATERTSAELRLAAVRHQLDHVQSRMFDTPQYLCYSRSSQRKRIS